MKRYNKIAIVLESRYRVSFIYLFLFFLIADLYGGKKKDRYNIINTQRTAAVFTACFRTRVQ